MQQGRDEEGMGGRGEGGGGMQQVRDGGWGEGGVVCNR